MNNLLLFDLGVEANELIVRESAIFVYIELIHKCDCSLDVKPEFFCQHRTRLLQTDEAISVCVEFLELPPKLFLPASIRTAGAFEHRNREVLRVTRTNSLQFVVDNNLLGGHCLKKLFECQHTIFVDIELIQENL